MTDTADPLFAEALRHHAAGRLDQAEEACRRIVEAMPQHAPAHFQLGNIAGARGRHDEAFGHYRRAVTAQPDFRQAYDALTRSLWEQGRPAEAQSLARQVLARQPEHAPSHLVLAAILHRGGRPDEAEALYRQALALDPELVQACHELTALLMEQGRPAEAVALLRHTLTARGDDAQLLSNLAAALLQQGDSAAAIDCARRALELRPGYGGAFNNLGNALRAANRFEDSLEVFRQALDWDPADVERHVHYALALFQEGRFREGAPHYERRWDSVQAGRRPDLRGLPAWDGGPLDGRTLLLYGEQGYGDVLMFCRYVPLLAAGGARIVLAAAAPLLRLLRSLPGLAGAVDEKEPLPPFDCHLGLMSLPGLLGSEVETIPAPIPYLSADPAAVAAWGRRLAPLPGLKVGLVWMGNPRQHNRAALFTDARRSLRLSQLAPLAGLAGVSFVSLQKEGLPPGEPPFPLFDAMAEVMDFADTAALAANLDLIITVDTAMAHLAGALGKPVWILSRLDGCWRWLRDRDDTPWYPAARLFRQETAGDWTGPILRLRDALAARLEQDGTPQDSPAPPTPPTPEAEAREHFRRALAAQRSGHPDDALAAYAAGLRLQPDCPDAVSNMGLCHLAAGRNEAAAAAFRQAIALHPASSPAAANAYNNLGNAWQRQGSLTLAEDAFRQALRADPAHFDARFNLGNSLLALQRSAEAAAAYHQALALRPDSEEALYGLVMALRRQGETSQAETLCRRLKTEHPEAVAPLLALAALRRENRDPVEAESLCRQALAIAPARPQSHAMLAGLLIEQGRFAQALAIARAGLAIAPGDAALWNNFGAAALECGDATAACTANDRALALRPDYPEALLNRSNLLRAAGQFGEALALLRDLAARRPGDAVVQGNLGNVLRDLGRLGDSLAAHRRGLALAPGNPMGELNYAFALLQAGHFAEGWRHYEARWRTGRNSPRPAGVAGRPEWEGGDPAGQTLLIHAEQGFGDTLQFSRLLPLLAARGARPVLAAPAPLLRLLRTLPGAGEVVDIAAPPPPFDAHLALLSLPRLLGLGLDSLPGPIPYLAADPLRAEAWRRRLGPLPGLKVGLVWAGASRDHLPGPHLLDARRSLRLAQFAPLAGLPVSFISLQKGPPAAQAKAPPPGLTLLDPMEEMADFADTAALVAALDLVISVDTAVAHLAGALGKPIWLLSRFDGCWRWLRDRDDSPWYPTLRLFRQEEPGAWAPVIERVGAALRKMT